MTRQKLIEQITENILAIDIDHPTRVAIDGVTASGKTTLAKELAAELKKSKREVIYTTLDGFHNPKIKRYERGRSSAEGYYRDAYNYESIRKNLLEPLGPFGNNHYKMLVFDLNEDVEVKGSFKVASQNSILIVDGSFSLRSELIDLWDYKIYLKTDVDLARQRAGFRDAELFGSIELAQKITKERYHGAHKIHNIEAKPSEKANIVILNNNPMKPLIVKN
jgi:uridine kinase